MEILHDGPNRGKGTHARIDPVPRPSRDEILSRLDVAAEFRDLGITFSKPSPDDEGWLECHAIGQEQRTPSAAVNVVSGSYYDAKSGEKSSLFDLAINIGKVKDIGEAFAYYSERASLAQPKVREPQRPKRPPMGFPTREFAVESTRANLALRSKPAAVRVAFGDDYRDAKGNVVVHMVRFEVEGKDKEIRPFRKCDDGKWRSEHAPAPRPLLNLPEIIEHDGPVWLVEGELCARVVGSLGLLGTTCCGGAKATAKTDWSPLAHRDIIILPDNDDPGRAYAQDVLAILHNLGSEGRYKVVELPGLGVGDDIADWVHLRRGEGKTDEEIRGELFALIASVRWIEPPRPDAMATKIICGSESETDGLKTWTPQALDALGKANDPPRIFQRGSDLVRIKQGGDDSPPTLDTLSVDALRGELDRCAVWGTTYANKAGETKIKYGPPRMDVVRDLAALPSWDRKAIPEIEGIIETPRFLPSGRLVLEPGYHADCRLFYSPGEGLEGLTVPERPSQSQVVAARQMLLDDLLVDFSFANQASRAAAVALTLLPFVRPMISDAVPLHHIGAACEGTGKSLLAAACCFPSLGREVDTMVQKESEAEWRKALTTAFMRGDSHICLDNLYNPLGWDDTPLSIDSGTLAAALTARHFTDRKLGGNEQARLKVSAVFLSTGNNVAFSRELTRRIVPIDLIAPIENPSMRTGFKHDPLLQAFVIPNRRKLLEACLTLCRHWIAKGCPAGSQVMGRYENYARTMGGLLDCIEVPGFLSNRTKLIGRNSEARRWAALVATWRSAHGINPVSTAQLWDMIKDNGDLGVAFADVLGSGSDLSQKQRLGKAIEKQCNQVWAEMRITRSTVKLRSGVAVYVLKDASDPYQDDYDEKEAEEAGSGDVPF